MYVGARVAAVQDPDFPPGEIALRSDHGPGRIERMTVALTVDGDTARLIRENEQQHPDDFAHAFEISARAVATAVQGLTGTVFKTDEQAFRALVARLPPALVPEWVLEPSAWSQHLWRVLDALYDLSKDRDRRNHHTPTGRVGTLGGTPQLLTMSPLMTPPRDGTESWITLAKLGLPRPDPRFELPVLPWTVGEGLVLRHDHVAALLDASLTSEDLETVVVAGSYGSFVGRVIRDGRLLLRIDLDPAGDRTLLLDPTDADLLAPGQRPDTHGDESRATPEPSAPLRAGGSASLRRGVADHLAFYTERAVAQGLEPGDDWESGPATAFTDRALSLLERTCLEGTDAWLVSMQGDYETLYAVIAASLLRGAT